jgi:hypothetical protein
MWPSVVVHEHWPVSQRMIVEMGDYAWSEHIVTVTRRRVHWSDESHFLLRPTDGRARVWHQRNTSFQDNHILGTQAMELSEQPLAVKNVVQFGLYVA